MSPSIEVRAHASILMRPHARNRYGSSMTSRRRQAANAWGALLQVHAALVPTLDKVVREAAGIPLSWYDVLLELAAEPDGRLRMSDLANRVVLSRTRVSRVSDELVARGLVVKEDYPGDRRSAYAVITDQGRRAFRTAAPIYLQAIEDKFAAALTNEELEQVAVLLNKVLKSDA